MSQPAVAASICLLGINCDSHQKFVIDTMRFAIANDGFQDLLRAAARALGALAASGRQDAAAALLDAGIPARDPAAPRGARLRQRGAAQHAADAQGAAGRRRCSEAALLLRDAFDMLEEDYEEERFFATVRRSYWQAAEGSPAQGRRR